MTLSCTTKTVGPSIAEPSPLPDGSVWADTSPPQPSGPSAATATPIHAPPTRPPSPRRETVISAPATTTRPLVADEDVTPGPGDIEPMPASQVLDWEPLVAVWFRSEDVARVLNIIACESSGRWNAQAERLANNGMRAQGLLQHLDGYWPSRAKRAAAAGYTNYGDIWSPSDQVAVSAWLAYNTPQGFDHWVCDPGGPE